MKTRIVKVMTGYNTCEISKRTIHKKFSKDHIKIKSIAIIECFGVYFSSLIEGEDFVIETEGVQLHTGKKRKRTQIYKNYVDKLYFGYIKKNESNKNSIDRTTVTEFSKQILRKEINELMKVKTHISFFIKSKSQVRFLIHCDAFIGWLEKRIRTKSYI